MSVAKRGLSGLSVLAVLLGLIALMSSSTRAEVGANWKIKGSNVTEKLSPSIGVKEIEKVTGTEERYVGLLTTLNKEQVDFRCTGISIIGAKLEPEGKITSGMKFKFSGCVFLSKGKISLACSPLYEGKEKGVIVTNALKGLLFLHEGKGLVSFEPAKGPSFMIIEFGEECVFFPSWGFGGKLTLKDASLGTESVTHLFAEGPLSTLALEGTVPTTFCGSVVWELTGEHKGLPWSGIPG
jgi:hypothetical protein